MQSTTSSRLFFNNDRGMKSFRGSFCLLLAIAATTSWSQVPQTIWASVFYGLNTPLAQDCAVDGLGNVYVLGTFSGSVDFDPGPSVFPLHSNDGNIFVVKLNNLGELIWAKQFGGSTANSIAIEVDIDGNAYISGMFYDISVDFDPGPAVQNLDSFGGFLLKLSSSGSFIWVRNLGGPIMIVRAMAIDNLGRPVVTGNYHGTIDFDPGVGLFELTSAGMSDVFVTKLTPTGDLLWAASMGGPGNDDGMSIAVDSDMNTYVGGYFFDTADFDPGPSSFELTSLGGGNAFVCKLGAQGGFSWAVSMGSSTSNYADAVWALSVSSEQVVAAGPFSGAADFNPSGGSEFLTSQGGTIDVFVSRYTTGGGFIGVHQIGGWEGNEFCEKAVINSAGEIILSGTFGGTVDFDPGVGTFNLSSGGRFVCKWNSQAEFIWAFSGVANVTAIGSNDELFCIGFCEAGTDVDPSSNVFEVSQSGALTMKLDNLTTGINPSSTPPAIMAQNIVGEDCAWLITFPMAAFNSKFLLMDMSGRIVSEGILEQGVNRFVVDLSKEASGVYLVQVSSDLVQLATRVVRW